MTVAMIVAMTVAKARPQAGYEVAFLEARLPARLSDLRGARFDLGPAPTPEPDTREDPGGASLSTAGARLRRA